MSDDITGDLDLLGDWLDAKGYTEEAGLCTRAMDEINKLRADIETFKFAFCFDDLRRLEAENEKLRSDVKTAVFADSAELKDVKRYNEELRGLLREAWVKMEANNLWSNLRARVAAALKETGDE